jgi:hypothetical protein
MPVSARPGLAALVLVLGLAGCAAGTPRVPADPAVTARLHELLPHSCNAGAAELLTGAGIDPARLTRAHWDREIRAGNDSSTLTGYSLWLRIDDQQGYVVVVVDRFCRGQYLYTRGGARI